MVFPNIKRKNAPIKRSNQTIIVSNHPSAFMDPLVIACFQKPIVFFMTRSDVFKPVLKSIFATANMLPIYRQMDGAGAVKKNKPVFEACYRIIKRKRSPLLFGEGLTDDVFERRLKPLKKGAARMAFGAMEFHNWELDLKIHCVGLNYEDPTQLRSGLLISNSDLIDVNSYRELYEANEAQAINQLTDDIEAALKNQITHIEDSVNFELHEQIMRLTFKGMHVTDHDSNLDLIQRQDYSRKLALQINKQSSLKTDKLNALKQSVSNYFNELSNKKIENKFIREFALNGKLSNFKNLLFLLFAWPIALLGIVLMGIPYIVTKKFIESTFKRKVFWLSTKMAVGMIVGGLFNIGIAIAVYHIICPNIWIILLYYFTVPAGSFIVAYQYRKCFIDFNNKRKAMNIDLKNLVEVRASLLHEIDSVFKF